MLGWTFPIEDQSRKFRKGKIRGFERKEEGTNWKLSEEFCLPRGEY